MSKVIRIYKLSKTILAQKSAKIDVQTLQRELTLLATQMGVQWVALISKKCIILYYVKNTPRPNWDENGSRTHIQNFQNRFLRNINY